MLYHRTTLSKFIIEDQRRTATPNPDLTSLLNDIQTACKLIAVSVSRGSLDGEAGHAAIGEPPADRRAALMNSAIEVMISTCETGGTLSGIVHKDLGSVYTIPADCPRGRCLLTFAPLDGLSNIDVNAPVGTIFSVLRCPDGIEHPTEEHFRQPGTEQIAAGYVIYGPVAMLVLTLGAGVHGFTLDDSIGAFTLTHPAMSIASSTREFAIDMSNSRHWEAPVLRYVEECVDGEAGARGDDFNMRWTASMVAEVHRILVRGGLFLYPRDNRDESGQGNIHLLCEANPIAFIVEQAGGAASTGRTRLLEVQPAGIGQHVPVILGSREEVERIVGYHTDADEEPEPLFDTPLFQVRTLFRTA